MPLPPVPPTVSSTHRLALDPIATPERLLLGPGPSNAHPTVLQALARMPIGHLDPLYIELMGEVQELLRYAWQTDNRLTIPMSGTGSAAMEATLANTIEPGDKVLVAVMGYFGQRLVDMAGRYRADVVTIERPWGEAFDLAELEAALIAHKPAILAMVHAETSTGVCQPMAGIGDLCRQHDCLLLLDTVTSLGAVPLHIDAWKVDLAYSCSQKGLSCPPGLGPFTMGPRAEAKLAARSGKVPNWYLDVSLLNKYWGSDRVYHHTAPVNMNFGMREALRLLAEEGLEVAWARHRSNAERLWAGLERLGLEMHVSEPLRLATLTTVRIPEGVDGKAFSRHLLDRFGIEVGGGLGDLAGKVWRIGLMGYNSTPENVDRLLDIIASELPAFRPPAAVAAAIA
ncbi:MULTISPECIES: alanine--glyoxylate aminotransferase family protein [unclassified Cyanobium]|uniref:pyridoxal-phosphate-dependent aminotransferase family protein n=1 Tax=unclassified Cyanobium TaxID=2627006 RepID=UPI0020CF2111|nr:MULTISPECIES: alanine--glyoxylate aminotransferase family protein [unclassified Cyanobium]MCP9833078.1 alanine--glyoxylate aminotransferase family protein [Cyanobium sp. La Preciosa 7G6]MCP9936059.1 alanine--glyoxylate aminotransferase family protein [Cyanobium sp. Aljojuca 7A6]